MERHHSQKSYSSVAIASRLAIEDPLSGLAGDDEDEQARYMEATVGGVRVPPSICPMATRLRTEIRLQDCLDGTASRPRVRAAGAGNTGCPGG